MPFTRRLGLAAGALIALVSVTTPASADSYRIDPAHTDIVFLISHFGYSNTIGRFNRVAGMITMNQADLDGASIELTIDTGSIDTNHAKRDADLRGPDFFNVAEFPNMTFRSTGIARTEDNSARVTGDLTLLGVTRPVTLEVTLNKLAPHPLPQYDGVMTVGFSARGRLERSAFGMGTFAPAIGDEVQLILEVEAFQE